MIEIILAVLLVKTFCGIEIRPRVVGGKDADLTEYPYVVMLITERKSRRNRTNIDKGCTGSLITASWVLSAAHCNRPESKWIRYGNTTVKFKEKSMLNAVTEQFVCPGYLYRRDISDIESVKNDIMLLKVQNKVTLTKYGRISGIDYKSLVGKRAVLLGFGFTKIGEELDTNRDVIKAHQARPLQQGVVVVVSSCPKEFGYGPNVCVSPTCDHWISVHYGDSGGPLVVDEQIVGVCSFAEGYQQAYAAISPFLDWINMIVNM